MTTLDSTIGKIIDGKYRVESLMGQGGMGAVYRVTHIQLNKTFALKLMKFTNQTTDLSLVMRFKREAEALARINHPNVVMITDYGVLEADQSPYIVMEFINGYSLRELLSEKGKLTVPQTIHIAKQICAGLHEAHSQGIIHRDLKPENIMIQQLAHGELVARVLDFGIAKLVQKGQEEVQNLTTNDQLLGTLKYISPEQAFGYTIDARSDVFGICLMIYEMLTGVVPAVMIFKVESLCNTRADVPIQLDEIIARGLSQAPDERAQSALALRSELAEIEKLSVPDSVIERNAANQPSDTNPNDNRTIKNRADITATKKKKSLSIASAADDRDVVETDRRPRRAPFVVLAIVSLLAIGLLAGWKLYPEMANKNNTAKIVATALPHLVPIKGGKFVMGNNKGDIYARPEHPIEVAPFQLGEFLITNRQYAEFVKQQGRQPLPQWRGNTPPPAILEEAATNVSWHEANAYCTWLTAQTGIAYRLPSEEEWEYVARDRANFGITDIAEKNVEWTSSEFYLYPGSKAKPPNLAARARMIRGKTEDNKDEPYTYRIWQVEDYTTFILGFRVAAPANQ